MTAPRANVLHLVDSLGLGGAQTVLKEYFESRAGDRTIHLYGLRSVPKSVTISHPNVGVNSSLSRFSMLPVLQLRRIVRERGISILHCHLFRAQVFGFLLALLFFPRIALVFHEHGRAVGREGESQLEELMFRLFLKLAWRRVDRFVCVSEHTRMHLLHIIPGAGDKTAVVTNPVPVHPRKGETHDREALRRAESVPKDVFVVGFASRLVDRKGWSDFLGAVALLHPKLPLFFLLAGDGEDREKAATRIKELGLEERGRMLGHIDWMRTFYRCLDCFVMPSHWEPHGLAHLEAQSFGVPVVVSNVPGLASTVKDETDALLFAAGDTSGLADNILRLATDESLHRRLVAGGLVNSARYTTDAFAASLEAIYASVTDRGETGDRP